MMLILIRLNDQINKHINDHERNIVEIKDFSVCVLYKKKKMGRGGAVAGICKGDG